MILFECLGVGILCVFLDFGVGLEFYYNDYIYMGFVFLCEGVCVCLDYLDFWMDVCKFCILKVCILYVCVNEFLICIFGNIVYYNINIDVFFEIY